MFRIRAVNPDLAPAVGTPQPDTPEPMCQICVKLTLKTTAQSWFSPAGELVASATTGFSFDFQSVSRLLECATAFQEREALARTGAVFFEWRARSHFAQQACVLDRNDALVGEGARDFQALRLKGPDLLAVDGEGPDQAVARQHGNGGEGTCAAEVRGRISQRIAAAVDFLGADIGDAYHLSRRDEAAEARLGAGLECALPLQPVVEGLGDALGVGQLEARSRGVFEQDPELGVAELQRVAEHRGDDFPDFP